MAPVEEVGEREERRTRGAPLRATRKRQLSPLMRRVVTVYCVLFAIYIILFTLRFFDRIDVLIHPIQHRAAFVLAINVLILMLRSAREGHSLDSIPWYDWLLIAMAVVSIGNAALFGGDLPLLQATSRAGTKEVIFAFMALVCMLEAGRRVVGAWYPALVAFFIFYDFFSNYFPGFMHGRGYGINRIAFMLYVGTDGMWSEPTQVASTVIIAFTIFAAFLQLSGAGDFFLRLSMAFIGHMRGGPAKVAVVASSMFGTFTGSPSANVAGTGVVTIPLMKRMGYSPEFAGAVECAASTGGSIMPPVMGTVAFLMVQFLGIPYINIMIAALVPAVLYYVAVYSMVHLEALRLNLRGIPKSEQPPRLGVLKEGWYFFLPVVSIIVFLATVKSRPEVAAVYAVGIVFLLSQLRPSTRMGPKGIIKSLEQGVTSVMPPGAGCALSAVLIGALGLPGIGLKLSSGLIELAGGQMWLLLLLTAIASLILGLGLSSVALYIITVTLVAPALISMGMLPIQAHMFVFVFAIMGFLTPPVGNAFFTAAAIADGDPMKTGWIATRLGIIAAIIPFALAYNPALLLMGSPDKILVSVVAAAIGTVGIACGGEGFLVARANWFQRVLWITGGVALLFYSWQTYTVGLAMVVVATVWHIVGARSRAATVTVPE